ncbi:hypothetical protein [Yoonia litorea]|uniref:Roadblock/LAMTOR2 domain-containing protein n=1 Tax=Yoonia litorea TaxID=1123755 RepID=A0A1I6N353_9RHOB|nr:hypothetical protein [Yoonia litorea]SFS22228.1 hypothetical protein SAMN05444714_3208 [Yoonia litorea]
MVVDELNTLRDSVSGCQMVAFADLSAHMILVTDSKTSHPREVLDDLCDEAATLLGRRGVPALGETPSNTAVWATQASLRVFLRAPGEPNDVLCCVCAPNVNVGRLVAKASACLDRISNG